MKPIIFNTEMVKAILEGRRTQFRLPTFHQEKEAMEHILKVQEDKPHQIIISKYKVGDILYVKETFQTCECDICEVCNVLDGIVYKADYNSKGEHPDLYTCLEDEMHWKPSIYMTKKYARIFLKVTNVRAERLQDIEFCDVFKEGIELIQTDGSDKACGDRNLKAFNNFVNLWDLTAKDGYKWEDNPYVFVYEFERIFKES